MIRLVALWAVVFGALILGANPSGASADRVVISTGREGGSYYYIGQRLNTALIMAKAQPAVVMTSQGSVDNLARLDDASDPVNVALAQADALRSYLKAHREFGEKFFVLGDMGKECVFLITSRTSGLRSAADLKQEAAGDLSVGAPGSGAAVTFESMALLDSSFHAARPVFVPIMEALLQLKVGGEFTKLRAAMLVQRPSRASPPLQVVLGAPETYSFIPITNSDVPNASLPDASPVYSFERVSVGGEANPRHQEIETLCTRALLLGSRKKLSPELRDRLAELMLNSGNQIAGTEP